MPSVRCHDMDCLGRQLQNVDTDWDSSVCAYDTSHDVLCLFMCPTDLIDNLGRSGYFALAYLSKILILSALSSVTRMLDINLQLKSSISCTTTSSWYYMCPIDLIDNLGRSGYFALAFLL